MANANTPRGLVPLRYASGAPYNGSVNQYHVPASDSTELRIGDPVVKTGTADAAGVASIQRASAGGPFTGVVQGFLPNGTTDMVGYRAASTLAYVLVCDDPDVIFEIQEDGVGGALAATSVGLNASVILASGTRFGSGAMLDSSTAATTAGLELKIVGLSQRPNNEIGANAKWLVRINDHTEAHGTVGL